MAIVKCFTFNPFQENTYIVYDETKACVIIDPGMYEVKEENELDNFIAQNQLKPTLLLNTHCHIDHIFGNSYVKKKYQIPFYAHPLEKANIEKAVPYAAMFGVSMNDTPVPDHWIDVKEDILFGATTFQLLFTPGHSAGSVCFYEPKDSFVISGDVLFMGSIGRTDLPGGDYDTLIDSIKKTLMTLPENTLVYSGHGPKTTLRREATQNPFLV